jgi:hypothetical protein
MSTCGLLITCPTLNMQKGLAVSLHYIPPLVLRQEGSDIHMPFSFPPELYFFHRMRLVQAPQEIC